jgi:lipopolysaccharide/colanic/teichoic acid biosynthesis glycosyltransferase
VTGLPRPPGKPYDALKRVIDVVGAVVVILVSAPVQGVIAALVARKLGRPVLFRQQRPGRNGVPFTLIKFRTMRDPDPRRGMVTDAQRLTPFGTTLRSTSLDELPTMWNVLRGDMSLIGPRPLLMQYLGRYSPEQARRHEVRPGVTGLAQVSGRNAITWDQKFAADVDYVDRRSLRLDASIALRTLGSVFRRAGIAAPGEATMPEFAGAVDQDGPS